MSDEVLVALNSNLGPAAPSSRSPIAEVDETGLDPARGRAWAFSVAINLPAATCSADGRADRVVQAKQAITQLLTPVEENGSLLIVKSIVARFNREILLQQKSAITYCFGGGLCPALWTTTPDNCGRVVASALRMDTGAGRPLRDHRLPTGYFGGSGTVDCWKISTNLECGKYRQSLNKPIYR